MSKNFNFNDYPIPPTHVNMPHMPVIILCDVSGSMGGTPIQNVNLSVNRFAADVCKDPKAAGLVDVAVRSFNEAPPIEQEFHCVGGLASDEAVQKQAADFARDILGKQAGEAV